ncbi:cytochrome P450 [Gordonia sp. (in: high G+C Gram-positive bacteria)]|uniref:cytochrome P450 n=1 Tax=Gordonia sp. (in: high G+C Gram-positive bacteria) TaxID=84139 RepID=UPI003F95B661
MTVASAPDIDLMDLDAFEQGRDRELFARLREEDPLHWNSEPDGGPGFWSVTRYADVLAVANNHSAFTVAEGTQIPSRRAEGDSARSVHHVDPPDHGPLRRVSTSHLRPVKVKALEPDIVSVIDDLLDQHVGKGSFNFVREVSARLPVVMISRLLGAPLSDCERIISWTNRMSPDDPDHSTGPEDAVAARDEIFDYFRTIEDERRAHPTDDLISTLAAATIAGEPLTRGQLDAYYLILMVAGNETTRNLLSGGTYVLFENPAAWELIRRQPAKARLAVEEMIRWVSPIICMRRNATRDVDFHGKTIRTGDKVVMWFTSANRDPRAFDRPDEFVVDRHPNDHLGFGWGEHGCLGSNLARLEAKLFYSRLAERNIDIIVDGEPARLRSNFFRGIKRLDVRLEQRHG